MDLTDFIREFFMFINPAVFFLAGLAAVLAFGAWRRELRDRLPRELARQLLHSAGAMRDVLVGLAGQSPTGGVQERGRVTERLLLAHAAFKASVREATLLWGESAHELATCFDGPISTVIARLPETEHSITGQFIAHVEGAASKVESFARSRWKSRRQWRCRALLLVVLAGSLIIYGCTGPTGPQMHTKQPREGLVLLADGIPGRAAIVYSYKSEINLAGLENLHPGDAHRQGRIFNALVQAQVITAGQVFVPAPASDAQLLAVHDPEYLHSLKRSANVAKAIEMPAIGWLPDATAEAGIVTPNRYATGGTVLAAELAMECGLAFNLGGGFQHAFRGHGEGFCMFADVPLAIHALRQRKLARRVMIVDTDIHQCNGFASYYVEDKDVAIFDIYEQDNYPAVKVPQTHSRPIPRGISEADYLALLQNDLPPVLDEFKPDVLFYVAGVDPLEGDRLGNAKLSMNGLVKRDLFVLREARKRNIPTVMVLAGGYHRDGWQATYRVIHTVLTGRDPAAPSVGKTSQGAGQSKD